MPKEKAETFVIFTDYGSEGFKIHATAKDFDEAVEAWKDANRNFGPSEIYRRVGIVFSEEIL